MREAEYEILIHVINLTKEINELKSICGALRSERDKLRELVIQAHTRLRNVSDLLPRPMPEHAYQELQSVLAVLDVLSTPAEEVNQ